MFITKIRFHWQAVIAYKNGEHLKILIEIFRRKLIVFCDILTFLDHLKRKIFIVGGGRDGAPPFSKSLDPPLVRVLLHKVIAIVNNFKCS